MKTLNCTYTEGMRERELVKLACQLKRMGYRPTRDRESRPNGLSVVFQRQSEVLRVNFVRR